jgi:hypothetical protein
MSVSDIRDGASLFPGYRCARPGYRADTKKKPGRDIGRASIKTRGSRANRSNQLQTSTRR